MRRAFAALLVGIAVAFLAACGGGSKSTSTPSSASVVKTYLTAIADGDGTQACSALSPAMQARALSDARSQGVKSASSCASLISLAAGHLTAAQRSLLVNAKVTSVVVLGNTATVRLKGASGPVTLTKTGGKWLITGATFGAG